MQQHLASTRSRWYKNKHVEDYVVSRIDMKEMGMIVGPHYMTETLRLLIRIAAAFLFANPGKRVLMVHANSLRQSMVEIFYDYYGPDMIIDTRSLNLLTFKANNSDKLSTFYCYDNSQDGIRSVSCDLILYDYVDQKRFMSIIAPLLVVKNICCIVVVKGGDYETDFNSKAVRKIYDTGLSMPIVRIRTPLDYDKRRRCLPSIIRILPVDIAQMVGTFMS